MACMGSACVFNSYGACIPMHGQELARQQEEQLLLHGLPGCVCVCCQQLCRRLECCGWSCADVPMGSESVLCGSAVVAGQGWVRWHGTQSMLLVGGASCGKRTHVQSFVALVVFAHTWVCSAFNSTTGAAFNSTTAGAAFMAL